MSSLPKLQISEGFISPSFVEGYKLRASQKFILWFILKSDPRISRVELLKRFSSIQGESGSEELSVSVRHLNRIRLSWGFPGVRGRPKKSQSVFCEAQKAPYIKREILNHGLHLFADWMEEENRFGSVVELLDSWIKDYQNENPGASFPLLTHKLETLETRFKALFYAPLFDVKRLSELDIKEHPLETLIGRSYQSSTLNQFLGQLERVEAGSVLTLFLLQGSSGDLCYIDGHMIPFWTSRTLHKGKITMLGRIMAGSNAVIAHDEQGNRVLGELYSPDFHLDRFILEYCEQIVSLTTIRSFVIDREINSVKMAEAFQEQQWGLLSMLDKNQYQGLEDWELTSVGDLSDGSPVYSGQWKDEKKRKEDQRYFVIVVLEEKILPYWANQTFKEQFPELEWPKLYSNRTEIQENDFKDMIENAALNINYGNKIIVGADRHQQRQLQKWEKEHLSTSNKIEKNGGLIHDLGNKVEDSKEKKHGKRLKQRQTNLDQSKKNKNL